MAARRVRVPSGPTAVPQINLPGEGEGRGRWLNWICLLSGLVAVVWFLVRVIPKPSRAAYPCQRVAFPIASGFVVWTVGLIGATFSLKYAGRQIGQARYLAACLFVAVAGLVASLPLFTTDTAQVLADPPQANSPVGVAQGIHPGRVVWVHDPAATDWDGVGDGHWFDNAHTDAAVVEEMLSRALQGLTGENTDAGAWDALFRYFNQRRDSGDVGYSPGQKIAIKVNLTLGYDADPVSFQKSASYVDHIDNSPQLTIALLDQLVNVAGVAESDIRIGDPSRIMPQYWYERVHTAFPDVVYTALQGGLGRTQETLSTIPFYWSDPIASRTVDKIPDYVPTSFVEADYVINFPILKSHNSAGITLNAKNHYGSLLRRPNEAGYYDMHLTWLRPDGQLGDGYYRALVDLMGHRELGGKTLLYLVDGLFAGQGWAGEPAKWDLAPFNGDWPNSIFLSQDPVAVDSVGFDFLYAEWTDYPHLSGADDYLSEAALAPNPPSGTFYDPERDGTSMESLGVHEHWNNPIEKQYSRNLENGGGIELMLFDTAPPETETLVVDNGDSGFSSRPSSWPQSSVISGYEGDSYAYAPPGSGGQQARWAFTLANSGYCDLSAQWSAYANRSAAAPYIIMNNGNQFYASADQTRDGGRFNLLGSYWLTAGTVDVVLNDTLSGYVIADAVELVCEAGPPPTIGLVRIEVEGPSLVDENTDASFVCRAFYSDNTSVIVAENNWTDTCIHGDLSAVGELTTSELTTSETCLITATYTEDGVTRQDDLALTIRDTDALPPVEQVIDNTDPGFSAMGNWGTSSYTPGYYGSNYAYAPPGSGGQARWAFTLSNDGDCQIEARWTSHENRSTVSPYTIINNGLETSVLVDQTVDGGRFNPLGSYWLEAGPVEVLLSSSQGGYVIADAVKLACQGTGPSPNLPITVDNRDTNFSVSGAWGTSTFTAGYYGSDYRHASPGSGSRAATWAFTIPQAGDYEIRAQWTAFSNRSPAAPYTILNNGAIIGIQAADQTADGGHFISLGSFILEAGSLQVRLHDSADGYVIADAVQIEALGP